MQTSYTFISSYKQRINAIDRAIARQQGKQAQQPVRHGPVEHRKLVQRFRQFLADEEKFWAALVIRLQRSFSLDEARPALISLGILSATHDDSIRPLDDVESPPGGLSAANGRNHFQFPPEDDENSLIPIDTAQRQGRLAILSKALVCLGDIARYREQYNESGGRSRIGHEDTVPGRRGRNRRSGAPDIAPRPRNYDKAQQCYEQARYLVPHEGNPSHQLAILASYKQDLFSSLVHYYRALCVRQPYDTAADNMGVIMTKALEQWRNSKPAEPHVQLSPNPSISSFKQKVVALHALWRVGMEKGIPKMESITRDHDQSVRRDFHILASQRLLPIDLITQTIVLSQGALWKHRMLRDPPGTGQSRKYEPPSAETSGIIEQKIFSHLLDLHEVLLEVGHDELMEPPPVDAAENDLAQHITATFRRTLPALRIASKWLRGNVKYFQQGLSEGSSESPAILQFWSTYSEFIKTLSSAFPVDKLPSVRVSLEEDIDMRGFLPLKTMIGDAEGEQSSHTTSPQEQVHPNVEQLMRISGLLCDAHELVCVENTPLARFRNSNSGLAAPPNRKLVSNAVAAGGLPRLETNKAKPEEDDMTEETSRTDEDVVRDAFQFLNTSDPEMIDEEDEEIVWDPRVATSPILQSLPASPVVQASPKTPVKQGSSPWQQSPYSPKHTQNIPATNMPAAPALVAPTTAQDLLNDVLGIGRELGSGHASSAPQPAWLFGSEANRPGHSIWSTSRDEQPLRFSGHQMNQPYQSLPRPPQNLSPPDAPSPWTSHHKLVPEVQRAPMHSPTFAPHLGNGHQRVPSVPFAAQLLPSHPGMHDPSPYPIPIQQPIQRPGPRTLIPSGYGAPTMSPISISRMSYENAPLDRYHSRHLSLQPSRMEQNMLPPSIPPGWGNPG
ncbi:hypothetical protein BD779DRAFT_1452737 [Infundibulicybe gibba]|nr:hypothetical protein BD779DRAFT_1452737 [Infundibulicybe gibba]